MFSSAFSVLILPDHAETAKSARLALAVRSKFDKVIYMSITEQELDQFIETWKREVGTGITPDWAAMKAQQLVDLYVTLCQKLPSER